MLKKVVSVTEYVVNFQFKLFLKFFIYHLLFFFFGPFSCPIIMIFDTYALVNNMAFWIKAKNKTSLIT